MEFNSKSGSYASKRVQPKKPKKNNLVGIIIGLVILVIASYLLFGRKKQGTAKENKPVVQDTQVVQEVSDPNKVEQVSQPENIETTISDEDYEFYNKAIQRLNEIDPEVAKSDEENIAIIAPEFGMEPNAMLQKLRDLDKAALDRYNREQEEFTAYIDQVLKDNEKELKLSAAQWIEEIEKQKVSEDISSNFIVEKYSYSPIIDGVGAEFKITALVHGSYREDGIGIYRDFSMVLGANSSEEIKELNDKLLWYESSTGNSFNAIAE